MPTFITLVVAALLGLIPASIASRKGRSFGGWWVYGTLLFIVALIHSLVLRDDTILAPHRSTRIVCPHCSGLNDADAEFCRQCGAKLGEED